jgi:uncharacterized repeat protein (TIGR01451 family)
VRERARIGLVPVLAGGGLIVGTLVLAVLGGSQSARATLSGNQPTLAKSACTISWVGSAGDGLWATAGNWSPLRVPAAGDVVCIPATAGTVTFDGSGGTATTLIAQLRSSAPLSITSGELVLTDTSATGNTVAGLSLEGGSIGDGTDAEASLTDTGDFSWTSGFFQAPGSQSPMPVFTVPSGHTVDIVGQNNANGQQLGHWTLSLASPLSYSGLLYIGAGGAITESSTATLADGADLDNYSGAGPFTLTGKGTLTKAGTSGTATIGVPLNAVNAGGSTSVPGGTLNLAGGGTIAVPWTVSPGATLDLNSFTLAKGTAGAGTGAVQIYGGTTTVTAAATLANPLTLVNGELNLASTASFKVAGFSLEGGQLGNTSNVQGRLIDDGNFSWTSGFFQAPASQAPQPVLTVTSRHTADIVGQNNANGQQFGSWTLSVASPLSISGLLYVSGGAITASSTVTLADGADLDNYEGTGPFTLTGKGTLTKATTSGTAVIGMPVINAGTVRAGGGLLYLASLANTGTLNLAEGTVGISSAYAPARNSKLAVTIAGTTAGTTYGQLQVNNTTTLAGSLMITTKHFSPKTGQVFTVTASSGTSSGRFTSVMQPITRNGHAYRQMATSGGITLTAAEATDLALTASAPAAASAGSPVDYAATVTNNGPNANTGVRVTFTLPSGVTFVSASPGCTRSGTTVTCEETGTLAVSSQASFTVDTTAASSGQQTAIISATGKVLDPDRTNNTIHLVTTVS